MPPDMTKSSVWDKLSDRQIQAVSFKLLNPDATYGDIAKEIEIPEGTIKNWRLNQIVAEIRKDYTKATLDYANRLTVKAMRILEGHLDSGDDRIAQSAAKEVLDRSIGKAVQRQELTGKDGAPLKGYVGLSPETWDDED